MPDQGPVVKIYELRVTGFEESKAQFDKMSAELAKLKKQKQDLDKTLSSSVDASKVDALTKKQKELTIAVLDQTQKLKAKANELKALEAAENDEANGLTKARLAYLELIKVYKEAKANSELMEEQFGKESVEAKDAAAAFVIYETELKKINALRKGNIAGAKAVTPAPGAEVPFTHNLNPDGTVIQPGLVAATEAVNDYDKAQAEAANTSTAFGNANLAAGDNVKAASKEFVAVTGSLDQYTGTLRDNIRIQIENSNAIAANNASQKSINDAIKESGTATAAQVEQLAALKEEAIVLDQTNKNLSATIRNQAKEFIAANGSLDEGRAKLNQLQQAYAQLSEAERAQPFGQGIKNEIDVLEPKIKELEGSIGLFQRNVGNYPSNFTGAFTVLQKEVDALQGKLVSGNFSGKELEVLTKKTAVLNEVTQTLNTTFKTTTQEQTAYKEAARQVGATFGTESEVFQNFTKEVGAGNAQLKQTDAALNVASGTGKKAGSVFQTLFSAFRNIANIIPGLGLSGLVLLLIAPLQALATSIVEYFTKVDLAKAKVQALNEVNLKAVDIYTKEATQVQDLAAIASNHANSLNARKEAIQQLIAQNPSYLHGLTLENLTTKEGIKILLDYNDAIRKKAELQASTEVQADAVKNVQQLKAEKEALQELAKTGKVSYSDLTEAQQKFIDESGFGGLRTAIGSTIGATLNAKDFARIFDNIDAEIKKGETKVVASGKIWQQKFKENFTTPSPQGLIEKIQADIKRLTDIQPTLMSDDAIKKNVAQVKKLQDQLNALLGTSKRDKLDTAEQNALKQIDATTKIQISEENKRYTEIEKIHQADFNEQITHIKKIEQIDIVGLNAKIAVLNTHKKLNADELATRAEFQEKISSIELETSTKIQEIEKKRFADQDKSLKESLDQNILQAKEAQKAALANPDASNIDKARADLDFIDTEIVAYKTYYNQLLDLNSNYNKESLQKVRDHINDLLRERTGGVKQELLSTSSDLQAQGAREITDINIQYQKKRKAILDNEKLTAEQKNRLIDQLSSANNITILTKELATLDQQLKDKFQLLLKGLVSEEDYEKLHLAAISKAGDLEAAIIAANNKKRYDAIKAKPKSVEQAATKAVDNLFNVDENSAEAEAVGAAVAGSFSLATDAMHNYYDAERARIQQSLDMNLQRLDVEEEQVKARAQSQAEIDSIDKQYAAKKLAAQKLAGEQTKKTKKAELKIALVTELANDAVAAAAYPFPFSLAIFGAMSALALGRYTLGLGQINAQQFAFGGNPDMTTTRGGRVKGRAHSKGGNPFIFKGRVFEDEVDELNIIRTKGVNPHKKYQLSGTHLEIASALNVLGGGLEFQRGAKVRKFDLGGAINSKSLGATLEAPVFVPSSNYNVLANNGNKEILEELKNLRKDQQKSATEISNWKDRFQVAVNATDITKIQKQQIKQAKVGTL